MSGVRFVGKYSFLIAFSNHNFLFSVLLLFHPHYKSELLPTCRECFIVPKAGIRVDAYKEVYSLT